MWTFLSDVFKAQELPTISRNEINTKDGCKQQRRLRGVNNASEGMTKDLKF
jgi:hypothetical protein